MKFILNGRLIEPRDFQPTTTLLQYLRQDCGLTGTKEGCAEGDCGACTVTLSDVGADGVVRHRAVNSCIQFLPIVHGKAVTTVEGVAVEGMPHPVQRAMVQCHASQCGFCTPGFVMSLYADYRAHAARPLARPEIDRLLSGNLCRCTGYRPIAAAAARALAEARSEAEASRDRIIDADLAALWAAASELVLDGPAGKWYAPRSERALARCLAAHPDARIVAGLTDVGLWSTKQLRTFDKLVFIGDVESLRQVRVVGGALVIGAAVTWSEAMPHLVRHWPAMADMLHRFAAPPVRNTATVGGNVANGSPIGDSMPAFIALGATVVLRGAAGPGSMAMEDFYLGYQKTALAAGQYVAEIRVPIPPPDQVFRVYKLSKRFDQDISAVCAGISMNFEGARARNVRIAFGGMAATPMRALNAEQALEGKALLGGARDPSALAQAQGALAADFQPISDMRASAAYRMAAARNLLLRFHLELRRQEGATSAIRLEDLEAQT